MLGPLNKGDKRRNREKEYKTHRSEQTRCLVLSSTVHVPMMVSMSGIC